jgi:UDP-glucose:(heptosyl)LPS alpha-1,3-glucosyltransferase
VQVIYNGVEPESLGPAGPPGSAREFLDIPADEPLLLFLGSGFERKGLLMAIEALARLRHGTLLVAGKDRPGRFQGRAHRLGLNQRVRFLGQRDDVGRLLAAADLLILPTIYDPCANSCLEALALGVPVVTTTANGAAELVEDGVSGFVVDDPRDTTGLAQACEGALGLKGFKAPALPSLDQWLQSTLGVLEEAARTAGGES